MLCYIKLNTKKIVRGREIYYTLGHQTPRAILIIANIKNGKNINIWIPKSQVGGTDSIITFPKFISDNHFDPDMLPYSIAKIKKHFKLKNTPIYKDKDSKHLLTIFRNDYINRCIISHDLNNIEFIPYFQKPA